MKDSMWSNPEFHHGDGGDGRVELERFPAAVAEDDRVGGGLERRQHAVVALKVQKRICGRAKIRRPFKLLSTHSCESESILLSF